MFPKCVFSPETWMFMSPGDSNLLLVACDASMICSDSVLGHSSYDNSRMDVDL